MNMAILNEIVNLTEENHRLFEETADLKAKLLDTQVELNAAYDRMAEPADLVIHHYHFTEDES